MHDIKKYAQHILLTNSLTNRSYRFRSHAMRPSKWGPPLMPCTPPSPRKSWRGSIIIRKIKLKQKESVFRCAQGPPTHEYGKMGPETFHTYKNGKSIMRRNDFELKCEISVIRFDCVFSIY